MIQFRAWRPGRPLIENRRWDGINVTSLAVLQIPGGSEFHINTLLLCLASRNFVSNLVKESDLVHSTDLYPSGYVASNLARRFNKPHTSQVIGSDLNLFLLPKLPTINLDWLREIKGFACNSLEIKKLLTASIVGINNAQVIYRGVDNYMFSPDGPSLGPQTKAPPIRFLYLGGFHTWDPKKENYYLIKGGPILLEAWKKVESLIQPSNLLISGPGVDEQKLGSWKATLKYPESVYFSKVLPPTDVPSFLRASDVLVIPSTREGLPNIANEAQACGRPVLGSNAGGIPETVVDGLTGKIVDKGDPDQLAEGLIWFHQNQDKILNMGENGRKRMSSEYSWDIFTERMLDMIRGAIDVDS